MNTERMKLEDDEAELTTGSDGDDDDGDDDDDDDATELVINYVSKISV